MPSATVYCSGVKARAFCTPVGGGRAVSIAKMYQFLINAAFLMFDLVVDKYGVQEWNAAW